jgi:hypothetical protein
MKSSFAFRLFYPAALGLILAVAACGEPTGSGSQETGTVPARLRVVQGVGQSAVVDTELPIAIAVQVVDAKGRPVPGVDVRFSASGTVSATPRQNDAPGVVWVRWRLGRVANTQQLEARLEGYPTVEPVTASAVARADVPAVLTRAGGNGASVPVGAFLPNPLRVKVVDRFNNAVRGVEVAWAVTAGGGSLNAALDSTEFDGTAGTGWKLGPLVGSPQTVRASVAGLTPVEFTATAILSGAQLQLARSAGEGQQGVVASTLADSLAAIVRLPDGRPVEGVLVSWGALAGSGSVTPWVTRSDAKGRVAASWRLGTVAGPMQAVATIEGASLTFNAQAVPGPAARLVKVSRDSVTGPVGSVLPDPPTVRLTDAYGNPLADREVEWMMSTAAGTTLTRVSSTRTDAAGVTRTPWVVGTRVGTHVARASHASVPPVFLTAITFTAGVDLRFTGSGSDQSGRVNEVLAEPLVVTVRLPDGTPVHGARVSWTVRFGGGFFEPHESATDAEGRATTTWRLGATPGDVWGTATLDGRSISFGAKQLAAPTP